jgi:NitT/TauT family transport system substrate-binding protein
MVRKLVVVLVVFALFSLSLAQAAPADTTLFLTYVPNIQFAPVYVGLEKGYFADAGFNVTIEHGDEPVGVDLIAAGQREFGVVSAEQVIAARANGRPVVFVDAWFQDYPVGIAVVNGLGVESVQDLKGKRVGIPGRFGASYSGLTALLSANGMTESDIQLEEIGFNAPEVICTGAIQAAVIYINNEPLQIAARAAQGDCGDVTGVTVFPVSDAVHLVSNGLVTNETMIAEHPDQVQAFVNAFNQSVRDAIDNPAEAYLLSASHVENLPLSDDLRAALEQAAADQTQFLADNPDADRETLKARRDALYDDLAGQFGSDDLLQFKVLLTTIDLWDADRLGYSDPASWGAMQETLVSMGQIAEPIDLSAAYTDAFVPES